MTQTNKSPEEIRRNEAESLLSDNRHRIWLWHLLLNEYRQSDRQNINKLSTPYILRRLYDNDKFRRTIVENQKKLIIDKSQFKWISIDNKRQINWVRKRVFLKISPQDIDLPENLKHPRGLCITEFKNSHIPINPIKPPTPEDGSNIFFALNDLSDRDLIILTFDLDKDLLDFKKERLKNLKNEWEIQANRDVKFDWFKDETFRKVNILREILQKSNEILNFLNTNISHHWELLEYFDQIPNLPDKSINMLIRKCKATYNQGVRRANNKDIRQYSAELKIATIDKLNSLASTYNFSVPQIIEIIVKNEYAERHYLSREEKLRKQLLEPSTKENKDSYI